MRAEEDRGERRGGQDGELGMGLVLQTENVREKGRK